MKDLKQADRIRLEAAEGWIGLGDFLSATQELDEITPELRAHPAVLAVRYEVYSKTGKWDDAAAIACTMVKALPRELDWWIAYADATRKKGCGFLQAKRILAEAQDRFPNASLVALKLACCECQLGNLAKAKEKVEEAIKLAIEDKEAIKMQALDDPDLKPFWDKIGSI